MTLQELLSAGAGSAPAITAPATVPLTYAALRTQVSSTVSALNALGIGRHDRVALVLPNGPDMATAFLSVASGATVAPLNPQYGAAEFEFYLSDLRARALIVGHDAHSPAVDVAEKLGVRVILLQPTHDQGAGRFTLDAGAAAPGQPDQGGFAQGDDIALVLHTSGTTARPKIVPLTHRNICASAHNVCATLSLAPADTGLVIMPLFHIHGLIAGILAPLAAGGSAFCTPPFNALKFFGWMEEAAPTWYSAVPAMHQAILARSGRHQATIEAHPLRFIRSSSASLSPQTLVALEAGFQTTVIESYGMTEAAHQMTSNPLPPRPRKPGSVGIAAGPEIAIVDGEGTLLPRGHPGEIVIRGENVTPGYENNPAATAEAFRGGWFHTGDQGIIDADGYLSITGRLKEIINRGGEKISPREVDDVLMAHPAVQQAVTFALPHRHLGEDVAAAVVLREGMHVTEGELREFVAARLIDFKVPRKVLFLDDLPKGATGKTQRIGLAGKLGLAAD